MFIAIPTAAQIRFNTRAVDLKSTADSNLSKKRTPRRDAKLNNP